MQFLRVSGIENRDFFPVETFFLVVQIKYSSKCPDSKKAPPVLKSSWLRACFVSTIFVDLFGSENLVKKGDLNEQNQNYLQSIWYE